MTTTATQARKPPLLSPGWRKTFVMIHVLASVGWFGIVAVILLLEVMALGFTDPVQMRMAYRFHELLVPIIVIPSAITTVISGVVLSIGTKWGLIRYYWPPAKLVLTVATIALTVANNPRWVAYAIANAATPGTELATVQRNLVALAVLHAVVLALATWLSVFKPFGRIRAGR